MQKAADAFRTISEVADDLALPQHVLRFWETRFPQIRPLKRAGGRRYYRPADVTLLRAIRQLLYDDGYTIKGVQRLLKEQGAKGLGAGTRAVDEGDTADAVAVIGAFGPDEMVDPTDLPLGEAELPAGGMSAAPVVGSNRETIAEALATIEECRRLLAHAMKSTG